MQIRFVSVVDTTPPAITLYGDSEIVLTSTLAFNDPGAYASDAMAGDLTASINVSVIERSNVSATTRKEVCLT